MENTIMKTKALTIEELKIQLNITPERQAHIDDIVRYYDLLETIRDTRKELGLTQEQVSKKSGLPRTTVSKIESGKINATLDTLQAIARAFDKKLDIRFL